MRGRLLKMIFGEVTIMTGPYGLELNESCESCKLKGSGFFCQWPETASKDFDAIRFSSVYPAGAILFLEKQT